MDATESNPTKMPPVKNGLLPYLTVNGAVKAAEFYTKAFGAEEAYRVPVDENGRTMHGRRPLSERCHRRPCLRRLVLAADGDRLRPLWSALHTGAGWLADRQVPVP